MYVERPSRRSRLAATLRIAVILIVASVTGWVAFILIPKLVGGRGLPLEALGLFGMGAAVLVAAALSYIAPRLWFLIGVTESYWVVWETIEMLRSARDVLVPMALAWSAIMTTVLLGASFAGRWLKGRKSLVHR